MVWTTIPIQFPYSIKMKINYTDFIGLYDNVFPDGFCDHVIKEFEKLKTYGAGSNRQMSEGATKTRKDDYHIFLNIENHPLSNFGDRSTLSIFFEGLQKCYDEYTNEYDILKDQNLKCCTVKVQRTDPGSGYHVWHAEQGPDSLSSRCLVYSVYLNDIESAGETEFLYQRIRVAPKENTLIIWPAAFTHAHRGNVVHGDKSKYIITGWFTIE